MEAITITFLKRLTAKCTVASLKHKIPLSLFFYVVTTNPHTTKYALRLHGDMTDQWPYEPSP